MLVGLKMGEAADRVKVVLVGETADTLKSVPLTHCTLRLHKNLSFVIIKYKMITVFWLIQFLNALGLGRLTPLTNLYSIL